MEKLDIIPSIQTSVADLLGTIDVPQRVLLSVFGFLAIINASSLRLCLDAALQQITQNSDRVSLKPSHDCSHFLPSRWTGITQKFQHDFNHSRLPGLSEFKELHSRRTAALVPTFFKKFKRNNCGNAELRKLESFNWSSRTRMVITSAFYVGYVFSQIPGGLLAQKYGGKFILALSLMASAVLALLTPLAIQHGGPFALVVLRVLIGICEGPAMPALSSLLARWIPSNERGKLGAFALSGSQMGIVFVNIGSTLVLHLSHWPAIFYFFGGCALIWSLCFILLCSNEPSSDPYIKSDECQYLQESISNIEPMTDLKPIPWKQIFINAPVWAMISSAVQYNWSQAKAASHVPPFLQIIEEQSLRADLRASLKASTPQLINWFMSILVGTLCDALVDCGIVSTTDVRRVMATTSAFGPRLFSDLGSCLSCSQHGGVISKVNCVLGIMGSFCVGTKLTPLDLSPNYAGILMAISNSVGSIASLVLPQLEEMFPNSSLSSSLRSTLCLISALLTSGDIQTFDSSPSSSDVDVQ